MKDLRCGPILCIFGVAAALAASCRDYDKPRRSPAQTAGAAGTYHQQGGGGQESEAGASPGGGGMLDGTGGKNTAAASGVPDGAGAGGGEGDDGGSGGGSAGGGAGSDGGSGPGGSSSGDGSSANAGQAAVGGGGAPALSPHPDPSEFGVVQLLQHGVPTCGAMLLNNSWLLTADSCVPTSVVDLRAAYGADPAHPDQVENVVEIVRFPGNDGSAALRGRDLVMLAVEHPFAIQGSTNNYHRPLWPWRADYYLMGPQHCTGWSFSPDASSARLLKKVDMTPFAVEMGKTIASRPAGDWVWWVRSGPRGSDETTLPSTADMGTGCFLYYNVQPFLTNIHIQIPTLRRDGSENIGMESVSLGLAEPEIRAWVDQTLLSEPEYLPLPALGPITASWSPQGDLRLVGVRATSGEVLSFTRSGNDWLDPVNLGRPPGVEFSRTLRPGAVFRGDDSFEVLAVDLDGRLWWLHGTETQQWDPWTEVTVATTAVTSGVSVDERTPGHFRVAARGEQGELRHAEYRGGWIDRWEDLGGPLASEPVIDITQEERINIFFTDTMGRIATAYSVNAAWLPGGAYPDVEASSPPAVGRWSLNYFDLIARGPDGRLLRDHYYGLWGWEWEDLGIIPPPGDPTMALRSPGHGDLFVSEADGRVWHISWPRLP